MQLGGGPDAANKPIADDVLANHIFPYLLDPKDSTSIASLNRVCRQWNRVLQGERPYRALTQFKDFKENYPEMAQLAESGLSKRASYLGSFPKTLYEKMVKAYNKTDANTSYLESNVLVTALATAPHIIGLCPWAFILSAIPSIGRRPIPPDLTFAPFEIAFRATLVTASAAVLGKILFAFDCGFIPIDHKICPKLYTLNYVATWSLICLPVLLIPAAFTLSKDSLLTEGYRTAKCGLSALSACAKTTCSKIRNWWTGAYS